MNKAGQQSIRFTLFACSCHVLFDHMACDCVVFVRFSVSLSCLFLCATCSPVCCLTPLLNWQHVRELKILLLLKLGLEYITLIYSLNESTVVTESQSVEYDEHKVYSFRV